jgi:hypothetical protein
VPLVDQREDREHALACERVGVAQPPHEGAHKGRMAELGHLVRVRVQLRVRVRLRLRLRLRLRVGLRLRLRLNRRAGVGLRVRARVGGRG